MPHLPSTRVFKAEGAEEVADPVEEDEEDRVELEELLGRELEEELNEEEPLPVQPD